MIWPVLQNARGPIIASVCALLLGFAAALPARALDLSLPFTSQMTTRVVTAPDSHALAIGPFTDGQLPSRILEGQVERQVLRLPGQSLTTLQLLVPLRDQLDAAGYDILFECDAAACGGFDFRFAIEVLPAPDMYVDLTDFRYLAARRGEQDYFGVLISASSNAGFIQIIRVTSGEDTGALRINSPGGAEGEGNVPAATADTTAPDPSPPSAAADSTPITLADSLRLRGHVILSDLTFDSGSAQLAPGRFATLENLADFLLADPTRRIALVGHTDAVGTLPGNINLSRQRANSVRQRLIADYAVPPSQLEAEGMGYLSPIAPNTDSAGREVNRRVEAVLLNID
ncbi:MAG: OmpA family protein [Rhodobacterales bacterium]